MKRWNNRRGVIYWNSITWVDHGLNKVCRFIISLNNRDVTKCSQHAFFKNSYGVFFPLLIYIGANVPLSLERFGYEMTKSNHLWLITSITYKRLQFFPFLPIWKLYHRFSCCILRYISWWIENLTFKLVR